MNDYSYLQYTVPKESATFYADKAKRILKKIKEKYPDQYEIFRNPSEVLTLSGVRAFDTYYELGKGLSDEYVAGLKEFFESEGVLLLEETFPSVDAENPNRYFSLLNLEAYNRIRQDYKNIPGSWISFVPDTTQPDYGFSIWWYIWQAQIATHASFRNIELRSLFATDCLMQHTMSFGMLLGYPGEAIWSSIAADDSREAGYVWAKIMHADKYDGAQPKYEYQKDLGSHKNIVVHEKLWSDILTMVYG
jgi:hypothetical protein